MRRLLVAFFLLLAAPSAAGILPLLGVGTGTSVSPSACGGSDTQFLARAGSLDATHTTAYTNLICGLVTDGVWTKLDFLHIYATQNSTVALVNLVSSSFNGTANGSPTFTTDRGFTGVDGSSTVYIDPNYNKSTTAASSLFVQNSAHMAVWSLTDTSSASGAIGLQVPGANYQSILYPKYIDNNSYFRVNTSSVGNAGVANTTTSAFFVANRSSSSAIQGYKDTTQTLTDNATTSIVPAAGLFTILSNTLNSGQTGSPYQLAVASMGSSLSSTDVSNYRGRLRTYLTAVGVP